MRFYSLFPSEHVCDLRLSTPSKTRNSPKIVISCSPDSATIVHPVQDLALLDDFVNKEHDGDHLASPSGLDTAESAIDTVSNITSSDPFTTVMGYLEKLVQIGGVIAEVNAPSPSPCFRCGIDIFSGSPVCETSMGNIDGSAKGLC
jgi:hypothetical protein